ncbi:hypothetical protein [Phycicoccus sp. DTK01]|uniref:hypothetical protein n=1 Tax=Phycicoccus sp. DTK01 TaxID=2785745 RepID=UPI001A8C2036|nr:hypothetical protein [Phycicoccus sp. DTK01]GIL37005.1 hypothetical protein PDTK01_30800 [Phycicoccus sp. DTK01]
MDEPSQRVEVTQTAREGLLRFASHAGLDRLRHLQALLVAVRFEDLPELESDSHRYRVLMTDGYRVFLKPTRFETPDASGHAGQGVLVMAVVKDGETDE